MKRKVILGAVFTTIALVGVINVIDYIYSATSVSASTSGLNMSATINPSSTINLSASNVSLDITPSAAGTLGKSSALVLSTYTNTNYDCTVTMTADSASLVSGVNTIPSLASGSTYTDATFTNDSWGFQIENGTNYRPVLAGEGANSIKTISSATGGTANTTNIYFAAKLTQATKPGTYTNTVTFASTCTPPTNYMQNVSSWINSVSVGEEVEVVDSRDGKTYTALKLTNGHMLMTQNLDHNIKTDGSITYDSTTTDIPSAWAPNAATTTTTAWAGSSNNGSNIPQSYDPGDLYWNGTLDTDFAFDGTLSKPKYISSTGDSHYHVGNFYNWTAAVAMNDSSNYTTEGTDVDQSICPAGWTLPTNTSGTGKVSWNDIHAAYSGITSYSSPLYYTLAGYWSGGSSEVGTEGWWWSREVKSSSRANDLSTSVNGGASSSSEVRSYGHSVRCISR